MSKATPGGSVSWIQPWLMHSPSWDHTELQAQLCPRLLDPPWPWASTMTLFLRSFALPGQPWPQVPLLIMGQLLLLATQSPSGSSSDQWGLSEVPFSSHHVPNAAHIWGTRRREIRGASEWDSWTTFAECIIDLHNSHFLPHLRVSTWVRVLEEEVELVYLGSHAHRYV